MSERAHVLCKEHCERAVREREAVEAMCAPCYHFLIVVDSAEARAGCAFRPSCVKYGSYVQMCIRWTIRIA